jgi:hypothetical protein
MVLGPVCDSDFTALAGLLPVNVILTPQRYEWIQTLVKSLIVTQRATVKTSAALGTWGYNRDREYPRFWGRQGSTIEVSSKSTRQSMSYQERAPEFEEGEGGEDVAPLALLS